MNFSKIKDVKTPQRGTLQSAGLDFFVPNDFKNVILKPNESVRIESGIKCQIPSNYVMIAFNKSGIALSGLSVGACVIDEDYQGEISLHVFNHSNKEIEIKSGQKLVQFILLPTFYANLVEVNECNLFETETERGAGGFGSTGI